ncbi:PilZ domain-containing protein [Vibrio zhugei]|uniref:Cyclic diguanosine monophosphate-binding protein n=1 Tax=Vibrio zhugei TaxID=2479546 RepID=A0ABV7C402_9VIBR|nr:PilZ domain-containing protein [Vibrio zhugei]
MAQDEFVRVTYTAPVTLLQGDTLRFHGSIHDISIHDLVITCQPPTALDPNNIVDVVLILPDTDIEIDLSTKINEMSENSLKLDVDHIDLESLVHYKRLVELNMGDDKKFHEDLEHLIELPPHE